MRTARPLRVTQTRLGAPFGNCLEACVAACVGVPVEDVPDARRAHGADGLGARLPELAQWLEQQGLRLVMGAGSRPPMSVQRRLMRPGVWIQGGQSPRGLGHAVLADAQGVCWDPHPSRVGLVSVDRWYAVVRRG